MWWLIPITILSAIFYRLGGWGDEGRDRFPNVPEWFFNTKARDIGCSLLCFIGYIILMGFTVVPWFIHLSCFLVLFASLTTYWDFITGEDNFWLHGFACGVAYIPYALYTGDWWQTVARCIVLAVAMGLISLLSGNDVVEETGRGASITASLALLLV